MTVAVRFAVVLLAVPELLAAQQPEEEVRPLPPRGSVAVGLAGVMEDGHSSRRLSVFWNASESWAPGVTATFGRIDIVEPELRWFPSRHTSPFFLSTSFIYRNYGPEFFGGSFALGLDSNANEWLSVSASLGWESLFASGRPDGPHWFRMQAVLAVVLPLASSN